MIAEQKTRKIIAFLIFLLILPLVSAANYGENTYGCGLFGIGCSDSQEETTTPSGSSVGGSGRTGIPLIITPIQFDVKILEIDSNLTLGRPFYFNYFVKGVGDINNDVVIEFWIEKDEKIISSGSDVIYFGTNEEKSENTHLFIPKEIEPGTYQLKVKASYGSISGESHRTIQLDIEEGIAKVEPLFEISFSLEEMIITNSDDLTAVIRFKNFGTTPIGFNLSYRILDSKGNEMYIKQDKIIVQTEKILRKDFIELDLLEGRYTFVLETLSDEEVYDRFEHDFDIKAEESVEEVIPLGSQVLFLVILILILSWLLMTKRREKKGNKSKPRKKRIRRKKSSRNARIRLEEKREGFMKRRKKRKQKSDKKTVKKRTRKNWKANKAKTQEKQVI